MNDVILTVSMPNYNHGEYLPRRIPSLLTAMPLNSELVIVDDGSEDNSVEIIEKFAAYDSRIVFIRNKKNKGINASLDLILSVARGKFLAFQSSDDHVFPHFFFSMLNLAQEHPNSPLYCSNFTFCLNTIPEDLSAVMSRPLLKNTGNRQVFIFSPDQIVKVFFKTNFWVPGHSSIIDRQWVLKMGGFNHELVQHADWFLIHSIALLGGATYLCDNLAILRLAQNSFSSVEIAKKKDLIRIEMKYLEILNKKSNTQLRRRFRNSGLLRGVVKKRFLYFCLHPKCWDIIFIVFIRHLCKKARGLLKNNSIA